MGNSPGSLRLLRNGDCSHLLLGNCVAIDLKKEEPKKEGNGITRKTWELSYKLERSSCVLNLNKTTGRNQDEVLEIIIVDWLENKINDEIQGTNINDNITREYSQAFIDRVRRAEVGLFEVYNTFSYVYEPGKRPRFMSLNTRKTTNEWGGVTETTVHVYGSGTRKGLYVREWKKRREGQNPYMGTLAHYYVYNNIGLSVVVKIRVLDDGTLYFDVEGPIQHPCSALFKMFEEVNTTGIWTPTSCSHCAKIQKQRNFMFSDTEESDNDNLPEDSRNQSAHAIVSNSGVVKGNGNGNLIVNRLYLALRGK
ncbi:uncharacterized protein LOC133299820 [Gastrolobium bilobum]|uniref:uncharacterized protein LOC133299820 n=1 Tax=Gastrolobium bilobum TaxID=150636 RepID=UPI002AB0D2E4|nr:uncharacterized protein LOC133299820 [Gastrolobium bilobum]XP_061355297.1 uncharacterized protein LOC133299820 [Gastrolobium bilobum]